MNQYRRFYLIFFGLFIFLVFVVVTINYYVDPYDFFYSSPNWIKPKVVDQQCLHKTKRVRFLRPQAVLLGASQVMEGFSPESIEPITGLFFYNAGLSGCNFEEIFAYFEHALDCQPDLKCVVVGLTLFGFNAERPPRPGFSQERLQGDLFPLLDYWNLLCSKKTLRASLSTCRQNWNGRALRFFTPSGLLDSSFIEYACGSLSFRQKAYKILYHSLIDPEIYGKYTLSFEALSKLKCMVSLCEQKNIELKFFFAPFHAIYWEAIHKKGLLPEFEELKRQVCAIVPVWDFSGFNAITTEPFAEGMDRLYYDCSHFRPFIGDEISRVLFGKESSLGNFGVLLTPSTIEGALKQMRQDHEVWRTIDPEAVAFVDNL